ncbi:ATP-binding protein [Methanobrevibacter sp.]|uniref:ATP-binding protein n=1 Tax=Methanobrevibacter sp. TaxID=66852 RepID=UPI00388E8C82
MTIKVFLSSNQREFAEEREYIYENLKNDSFFGEIIDLFVFEKENAKTLPSDEVFINEVLNSDIYIGLIGENYGSIYKEGISATEYEYDSYISKKHAAYIFIKDNIKPDENSEKFLNKIKNQVTYKRFNNKEDLLSKIKKSLKEEINKRLSATPFDEEIILDSSVDDVDMDSVKQFKNVLEDANIEELFDKRELEKILEYLNAGMIDSNGNFHLTTAGALFFGQNITKFNLEHEVKMVRFNGTERIEIIDKYFTKTSFLLLIKEFEQFFRKNTKIGGIVEGFKRVSIPEYPIEAVREAFINALAHRDYSIKGDCITFYIYDDRIEIISPGKLPYPLTVDTLGIGNNPKHRNENICNIFEKTKYMEHVGTGITRMRMAMDKHNLPEPEFFDDGYFRVILRGPDGQLIKPKEKTVESLNLVKYALNERQTDALLDMVNNNSSYTYTTYMEKYDVSHATSRRDLNDLYDKKLVEKYKKKQTNYFEII